MDGLVVTGSVHAATWRCACDKLWGLVWETIYGGWIEMSWLRRNFGGLDEDSSEVERERHVRAYILQIIGGILMLDKSRNLIHLRSLLKLINYELSWGFAVLAILYWEMCRATQSQKIKIECIIEEFFMNPNIWHVNVPLVVYATIEMHESDREAIVVPKLTPKYMPWFRIHGKRYLYGEEARGLQLHTRRPQRAFIHPKTDEAGPSSATMQEPTPTVALSMVVPPTAPSPMYYTPMPSTFPMTTMYRLSMFQASNESPLIMPSVYGTQHSYTHFPFVTQTPLRSLFYQSGSSSQPLILIPKDARWQPKMHRPQSTKGEEDGLPRPQPQ
ncbi:hypothetical protein Gogos_010338 [Gossypium gossypioides]|uniref:Aminotransferase-like plant mobile domain-containing protein n=1 Tax=Gossypium gossypioides TaxID=34282 RepID=A0A7J9BKY2_GOSGO|nr:hypothetical protein [Gossypium gossypioides]